MVPFRLLIVGASALVLLQISFFLGAIFWMGEGRLSTFHRVYSRLPVLVSEAYFADTIVMNKTSEALNLLQRQKKVAEFLGMNSLMRRDLIENTYTLFETVSSEGEYIKFEEWLHRLEESFGEQFGSYWLELVKSRTGARLDPTAAAEAMNQIREHMPANADAYREVVRAAVLLKNEEELKLWCKNYMHAPHVALASHPLQMFGLNSTTDYKFQAFLESEDGRFRTISDPLNLHRTSPYIFRYLGASAQHTVDFAFRLFPGTIVVVNEVKFVDRNGNGHLFTHRDLDMLLERGFFLDEQTFVPSSEHKHDILTLAPIRGIFPESVEIQLDIEIKRMKLTNNAPCN